MSNTLGALLRLPAEKYFDSLDAKCPQGLMVQVKPDRRILIEHVEGDASSRKWHEPEDIILVPARLTWELLRDGDVTPVRSA